MQLFATGRPTRKALPILFLGNSSCKQTLSLCWLQVMQPLKRILWNSTVSCFLTVLGTQDLYICLLLRKYEGIHPEKHVCVAFSVACSHGRSVDYFIESILSDCFIARKTCSNVPDIPVSSSLGEGRQAVGENCSELRSLRTTSQQI